MTCIKTGAIVHFVDYGFIAPADLYSVANVIIIRWNVNGKHFVQNEDEEEEATHQVYLGSELNWHRDDLGVTVVPRQFIMGPV